MWKQRATWKHAVLGFMLGLLVWWGFQLWLPPPSMMDRVEETIQEFQRAIEQEGR